MKIKSLWALCLLAVATAAVAQTEEEHPVVTKSSAAFEKDAESVSKFLADRSFGNGLTSPSLGSTSSGEFEARKKAIKTAAPIPAVALGSRSVVYDVILQPGHYDRKSGRTGTSGLLVSEQELTAYVVRTAADRLRGQGLNVLVVSADNYLRDDPKTPAFEGLRTKVFLAVHADGSVRPCTTGPSLAYDNTSSTYAMHALGWGLSRANGYNYKDFRKDNFTADAASYYMFREVRASELSGLLELGELTCKDGEVKLIENARSIAGNVAHAIQFVTTIPYAPA